MEDVLGGNHLALLSLSHLVRLANLPDVPNKIANLQTWFQQFRVAIHEKTFAAIKSRNAVGLMDVLATGVAALLHFVQENITG